METCDNDQPLPDLRSDHAPNIYNGYKSVSCISCSSSSAPLYSMLSSTQPIVLLHCEHAELINLPSAAPITAPAKLRPVRSVLLTVIPKDRTSTPFCFCVLSPASIPTVYTQGFGGNPLLGWSGSGLWECIVAQIVRLVHYRQGLSNHRSLVLCRVQRGNR